MLQHVHQRCGFAGPEEAAQQGLNLDKEAAREIVYGMPYAEWKAHYQTEATPEQTAAFTAQQNPSGGE